MKRDLIVLGNLLLDDIVYADGRTRMAQPGGAVLHLGLAARLWGIEVGIVTVVGDDYPGWVLEALGERGVDLAGIRPFGRPGLRTWLLYEGRRRRVVHRLDGPTHEEVSPSAEDIPPEWEAQAFHLAPMPFRCQRRILETLTSREGVLVSVDPYELLTEARLEAWRELLAGVDILFLSEDELEVTGALDDPKSILKELAPGPPEPTRGLRLVALKRGARGGLLWDAHDKAFLEWSGRAAEVVDPTGAGDAFAGGFLAGQLRGEPISRALAQGVVSASFALEGLGADGLLAATPDEAESRRRDWFES